jgi:4-amino-4-deoxy-L-arabinose transferase-like glycosyltransferase
VAASRRRWRVELAVVTTIGLVVRLVYVIGFKRGTALVGDASYYHQGANLLWSHGFIHPPVFDMTARAIPGVDHPPGFLVALGFASLAGLRSVFQHRIASALIGTATVAVIGLAGRRMAGERVGLVAASLAAIAPSFWLSDGTLMSETMTLLVTAVVVWAAYAFWARPTPRRVCVLGGAIAALALTRAEALVLPLLLLVPLCLALRQLAIGRRLFLAVIGLLVVAVAIAPWTAFNLSRQHHPVIVSTGLGFAMRVGACDATFYGARLGYWRYECGPQGTPMRGDASDYDVTLRQRAVDYLSDHIDRLPVVALARLGRTFAVFRPAQQVDFDKAESGRDPPAAWGGVILTWLVIPAAIAGAFILRRRAVPLLPLLSVIAMVCIAVVLTFGQTRYRAPAEVPLVLLAAVAFERVARRRAAPSTDRDVE